MHHNYWNSGYNMEDQMKYTVILTQFLFKQSKFYFSSQSYRQKKGWWKYENMSYSGTV